MNLSAGFITYFWVGFSPFLYTEYPSKLVSWIVIFEDIGFNYLCWHFYAPHISTGAFIQLKNSDTDLSDDSRTSLTVAPPEERDHLTGIWKKKIKWQLKRREIYATESNVNMIAHHSIHLNVLKNWEAGITFIHSTITNEKPPQTPQQSQCLILF